MLQRVLSDLKFQTSVNFTKSETCYLLHFCHTCLSLICCELAVAQCSSFVKHHEWIPAMYFVAMFVCFSMFNLLHLDGYLLFITDRCHICFACHFQTIAPIAAFFISFSSDFISSFQWHTCISKLRLGSVIPCQILHMHDLERNDWNWPQLGYPRVPIERWSDFGWNQYKDHRNRMHGLQMASKTRMTPVCDLQQVGI